MRLIAWTTHQRHEQQSKDGLIDDASGKKSKKRHQQGQNQLNKGKNQNPFCGKPVIIENILNAVIVKK